MIRSNLAQAIVHAPIYQNVNGVATIKMEVVAYMVKS